MLASQRLARPQCRPSIVLPPSPAALVHAPRQQPASVVRCCPSTVGCTSLQLTTGLQGRPSRCPTTNGQLHRRPHAIQPGGSRRQHQNWQQQQQQPINGCRAIASCLSSSRRMVRTHASGPGGLDGPSDEEDDGFPAEDEEDDSLDPLAAGFGEEDDDGGDAAAAVDDPFMKRLFKAAGKGGKRGSGSGSEELLDSDDLDAAELEDLDDDALAEVAAAAAAAEADAAAGADDDLSADSSPGGVADEGEGEPDFPERPQRWMLMSQLFRDVAMEDEAEMLAQAYADGIVAGIQSDPAKVLPGDLYVEHDLMYPSYSRFELAAWAIQNGCSGIVIMPQPDDEDWGPHVPEDVPIIEVPNPVDTGQLLAAAFYGAPSRDMFMVNITGSHGKTTVAWLVRGILEQQGQVTGMIGSIEHALAEYRMDNDGDIWQPTEEDPTADRESSAPFRITPYQGKYVVERNPPGMHLQKLLAGMRDRGAKWCITEASTPALELGFYDLCETNVAVFTNLGDTDLAFHEGREGLEEAVYKLFEGLEDGLTQAAVINVDDEYGRQLQKVLSGNVPMTTFGIDSRDADVYAENVDLNTWESEMIIRTPKGRLQIITSLLGRHNVYNVVAAVAVGISLNVPLKSIVAGIEAVEVIPGRCEVIDEGQNFSVIVDAARTPQAVAAMLDATKAGKSNRTFCVVGASAGSDKEQRRELGKVVHERAEYVILTNENPGNEDAGAIISDIVSGFPDEIINRYNYYAYFPFQDQTRAPLWFEPYLQSAQRAVRRYIFEDRFSAIRAAIGTASEGDTVLILGKGDEDFIEYPDGEGGVTRGWFDDRVECRAALSKLKYLYQLKGTDRRTLPWTNGKVKEPDEADFRIMGSVTSATAADAVAWVKKETRRPVGAGVGGGGDDDGSESDDGAEFDE